MKKMNQEEKAAEKYLIVLSKGEVEFEPDGNVTPDFSLASTIGIEVRRLNQNFFDGNSAKGLEEVDFSLHRTLKKVLNSYDASFDGHSYWVGITFNRPLCSGKRIAGDMRRALDSFLKGTRTTPCSLKVNENIEFEIHPSSTIPNRVFRYAITSDDNEGGVVVQLYIQNIGHCIQVKEQKVAPFKKRYNEWWLLLVDTMMAWQLTPFGVEEVRTGITQNGGFDKIIVIDYLGEKCLLEIRP